MTPDTGLSPRFRGVTASSLAQNLAGGTTVIALGALGVLGVVGPLTALAFFAVGAGAGYSLSGSV